ncbi:hypothetical protein [Paraburkholderia hayleyella]|uniref:hypothetical protein n=1 Tax=Paraburkholderia hayleyella TaxID=2152889 RepID=UPI00129225C4|nr:hypothetical protein [Paraburkholderia hayleyella]
MLEINAVNTQRQWNTVQQNILQIGQIVVAGVRRAVSLVTPDTVNRIRAAGISGAILFTASVGIITVLNQKDGDLTGRAANVLTVISMFGGVAGIGLIATAICAYQYGSHERQRLLALAA